MINGSLPYPKRLPGKIQKPCQYGCNSRLIVLDLPSRLTRRHPEISGTSFSDFQKRIPKYLIESSTPGLRIHGAIPSVSDWPKRLQGCCTCVVFQSLPEIRSRSMQTIRIVMNRSFSRWPFGMRDSLQPPSYSHISSYTSSQTSCIPISCVVYCVR